MSNQDLQKISVKIEASDAVAMTSVSTTKGPECSELGERVDAPEYNGRVPPAGCKQLRLLHILLHTILRHYHLRLCLWGLVGGESERGDGAAVSDELVERLSGDSVPESYVAFAVPTHDA